MNPLSKTKERPETKEEKNKYVSYIFMLGERQRDRQRAMFENHESPAAFPERGLKKN